MSEQRDELRDTIEKVHQLDKVEDHLDTLENELDTQYARLSYLDKKVEKEYDECRETIELMEYEKKVLDAKLDSYND